MGYFPRSFQLDATSSGHAMIVAGAFAVAAFVGALRCFLAVQRGLRRGHVRAGDPHTPLYRRWTPFDWDGSELFWWHLCPSDLSPFSSALPSIRRDGHGVTRKEIGETTSDQRCSCSSMFASESCVVSRKLASVVCRNGPLDISPTCVWSTSLLTRLRRPHW